MIALRPDCIAITNDGRTHSCAAERRKSGKVMPMTNLKVIFVCLMVCSFHAQGQRVYKNRNFGFSVIQPQGWSRQEAFDRNGVTFDLPNAGSASADIKIGARVNQPSGTARSRSQTVDEILNTFEEALEKDKQVEKVSVLRKAHIIIAGMDAGVINIEYIDRETGRERYVIEADAIHPSGAVYFVDLECDPSDSAGMNPIFEGVLRSLTVRKNPRGKLTW